MLLDVPWLFLNSIELSTHTVKLRKNDWLWDYINRRFMDLQQRFTISSQSYDPVYTTIRSVIHPNKASPGDNIKNHDRTSTRQRRPPILRTVQNDSVDYLIPKEQRRNIEITRVSTKFTKLYNKLYIYTSPFFSEKWK